MQLVRILESSENYPAIHRRLETLFAEARTLGADATARPAMADTLASTWRDLSKVEDLAAYLKGGLIQIFKLPIAEHDIDGTQLYLWQRVQIGTDKAGEYLPPSVDWDAFCTQHLGISRSTASHYSRNFQVYYQMTSGFGVVEMVTAGIGKLKLARTYVETHGLTDAVRTALVGDEHKCAHCGCTYTEPPLICSQCGQAFAPTKPATYAEVEMLVASAKSKQKPITMILGSIVETLKNEINVYASLVLGDDHIDLPVWEIPIGDEDEQVPAEMIDAVVRLLRRKLS